MIGIRVSVVLAFGLSICAQVLCAASLSDADLYAKVRARFPELNLPETVPTFHVVTSHATLQAAINTAASSAADDLILLDGRASQIWTGETPITVNCLAGKGGVIILSQDPETGAFDQPVRWSGFGLSVSGSNQSAIYLANFSIQGAVPSSPMMRAGGIYVMGAGELTGTCLSITGCGTSAAGAYCWGGAVLAMGATATFYNSTFANNANSDNGMSGNYGAVSSLYGGNLALTHCTIAGNRNSTTGVTTAKDSTSTLTLTNCWVTTETLEVTTTASTVPYIQPAASSPAVNNATTTVMALLYDAIGNPRINEAIADLGAVEMMAQSEIETAADLVILPSGPYEVYLGWSYLAKASDFKLECSLDDGATWEDVTAETIWRQPDDTEGTTAGWQSARHVAASPASTALYRLSYAVKGESERITEEARTVTTPAVDAVPCYHSRPQASQVIYLDFQGYVDDFSVNVFHARRGLASETLNYIQTAPFRYEGRFKDLSKTYPTADAIYDIWRMVAEDFAMFDVDVTTEAPAYDALVKTSEADMTYGKRVVIGYADGTTEPWMEVSGGFSGGGPFGFQYDRPAYVFGVSSRQEIATQITHEVSHTFNLSHDAGAIHFIGEDFYASEYYKGVPLSPDGTRIDYGITWYPVMGDVPNPTPYSGYYYDSDDFINQWSRGSYSSAENKEDDISVILGLASGSGSAITVSNLYPVETRSLALLEDDAGDTPETAKMLATFTQSEVVSANAVIGKHLTADRKGVDNDLDCFTMTTTSGGTLAVEVEPNYLGECEGSSLDAMVEVLNSRGESLATATTPQWAANEVDFTDIRNAACTLTLPAAGTYTLRVSGTVHPVKSSTLSADGSASAETPWYFNDAENYGSIGPYTLTATFTATPPPALPKPFVGDTTDYSDRAVQRILAATGGAAPGTIVLDDGKGSTLSAADLSEAIGALEGILCSDADNTTLTIAYRFNVAAIDCSNTGLVTLTLQVAGASETQSVRFNSSATFVLFDPLTQAEIALPEAQIVAQGTAGDTLKLTFSAENKPKVFAVRLLSRPAESQGLNEVAP